MDRTHCESVGRAFGGEVVAVPIESVDEFYKENTGDFTTDGRRSFLTALKIPVGFFDQRNAVLRNSILIDVQQAFREKHERGRILCLVQDDHIQYAAPDMGLGAEDPETALGLDPNEWNPRDVDYKAGYVHYVNLPKDLVVDEYVSTAHLALPLFYAKPLRFELGLFKVRCSNGAVDDVMIEGAALRPEAISGTLFAAFARGVLTVARQVKRFHENYLDILKAEPIPSLYHAREFYKGMVDPATKKAPVPKKLLDEAKRHVDLIEKGEPVPPMSPEKIETEYDLFDTLIFYAQQLNSVASRRKAEANTFRFFRTRHAEKLEDKRFKLSLVRPAEKKDN